MDDHRADRMCAACDALWFRPVQVAEATSESLHHKRNAARLQVGRDRVGGNGASSKLQRAYTWVPC